MKINDGRHLTYCTNIHPGETWKEVKAYCEKYLPTIKSEISPDQPFGVGLRLSNVASMEILEGQNLPDFKKWLDANDLYVFTVNGFPYGGFHQTIVKDNVHKPDWTSSSRVDYTCRLFKILSELLPENMQGGISTSPISYKHWWGKDKNEWGPVWENGTRRMLEVLKYLIELERETGKMMHLDIEPEPDGLIENTQEVLTFFSEWLLPKGVHYLKKHFGFEENESKQRIVNHIQICYDVCHFAVGFEDPKEVLSQLSNQQIKVGKIQISAAMKGKFPADEAGKKKLLKNFEAFDEPTYLHQVVAIDADEKKWQYPDLPEALSNQNREFKEWRTHFHVPLFAQKYELLESTQHDILSLFEYMKSNQVTNHLEIETYTWEVLPPILQTDIASSIIREFNWVLSHLKPANANE